MWGSGICPISIGRSADAMTWSPRTCVPAEGWPIDDREQGLTLESNFAACPWTRAVSVQTKSPHPEEARLRAFTCALAVSKDGQQRWCSCPPFETRLSAGVTPREADRSSG